jgi:hypothetical protein
MIAADDQKILPVEIFLGVSHAAGRAELGLLMDIGDVDAKEGAIPERCLDILSQVPKGHHHFAEP